MKRVFLSARDVKGFQKFFPFALGNIYLFIIFTYFLLLIISNKNL